MSDHDHVEALDGLTVADVRAALGREIDECRRAGWDATREGRPGTIPTSWLSDHTGRLLLLDQAIARLERMVGAGASVVGR